MNKGVFKSLLYMMITCLTAVGIYYLGAAVINMPGSWSMAAGIAAAVLLSWLLARKENKK